MLPIEKMIVKYNYSKRNSTIKYIVIHDTGNTGRGAGVNNHFKYINGGNRGASADYFVDDNKIGQFVEDYNYSWHCGDGKGKYGITNSNSIGIEICINSDGNYERAVANAIDLTKYLMNKYNIPVDRVVRHYDASRKSCPNTMRANDWAKWKEFKSRLTSSTSNDNSINTNTFNIGTYQKPVKVTADSLNIRSGRGKEYGVIGSLSRGAIVTVNYILPDNRDGRGNTDLWGSIDYKGQTGYIHLGFVLATTSTATIREGSKVKIIGSTYATGQSIPNWAKNSVFTVTQLKSDRALLDGYTGGFCSWVYLKDLKLA